MASPYLLDNHIRGTRGCHKKILKFIQCPIYPAECDFGTLEEILILRAVEYVASDIGTVHKRSELAVADTRRANRIAEQCGLGITKLAVSPKDSINTGNCNGIVTGIIDNAHIFHEHDSIEWGCTRMRDIQGTLCKLLVQLCNPRLPSGFDATGIRDNLVDVRNEVSGKANGGLLALVLGEYGFQTCGNNLFFRGLRVLRSR